MRSQSHEQFVMSSEVETSRHVPVSCAMGFDSLISRSLSLRPSRPCRGLPGSSILDFARNDRYEMLRPH